MKISLFTNRSSHGILILEKLLRYKIKLNSIYIEQQTNHIVKTFTDFVKYKKLSIIISFFIKNTKDVVKNRKRSRYDKYFFNRYSKNINEVKNFNSPLCFDTLKNEKPDILILAGSRILGEKILSIPRIGTLNAHPGLLPNYRGIDVVPWAIYNGDKVGVTIHFVNEKVDDGKILLKKEVNIEKYSSLYEIKKNVEFFCSKMMVYAVLKILCNKSFKVINFDSSNSKIYTTMPSALMQIVEQKLRHLDNK